MIFDLQVRLPLMILPMTLSATVDAQNALGRLSKVFMAEILTDDKVIDRNADYAVKIEHADFAWDSAEPVAAEAPKKKGGPGAAPAAKKSKPAAKGGFKKWRRDRKSGKITVAEEEHSEIAAKQSDLQEASAMPVIAEPGLPESTETATAAVDREIFQLHDVDLEIPRGALVAVVGPIGSGKSSFISGLMGEMKRTSGKVAFGGTTALCSQVAWIVNDTVRANILFGLPFDEERYWQVIRDSCLEPDLDLFEDGDATVIGEKGINLSGKFWIIGEFVCTTLFHLSSP